MTRSTGNGQTTEDNILGRWSEPMYTFCGVPMTETKFTEARKKKECGECPFCGKTGLSNRYGSRVKHIVACAKKAR